MQTSARCTFRSTALSLIAFAAACGGGGEDGGGPTSPARTLDSQLNGTWVVVDSSFVSNDPDQEAALATGQLFVIDAGEVQGFGGEVVTEEEFTTQVGREPIVYRNAVSNTAFLLEVVFDLAPDVPGGRVAFLLEGTVDPAGVIRGSFRIQITGMPNQPDLDTLETFELRRV